MVIQWLDAVLAADPVDEHWLLMQQCVYLGIGIGLQILLTGFSSRPPQWCPTS